MTELKMKLNQKQYNELEEKGEIYFTHAGKQIHIEKRYDTIHYASCHIDNIFSGWVTAPKNQYRRISTDCDKIRN